MDEKKEEHNTVPVKEEDKLMYEPDDEFEMKTCCGSLCGIDKPLCLYMGKFSISVGVLVFCFFMLQDKSNSAEFYTGTIAGLLGHYLNTPIPQIQSKGVKKQKKD